MCRLKREKDGRGWCFSKGLWLSDPALVVFILNFHLCDLKNLVRGCSGSYLDISELLTFVFTIVLMPGDHQVRQYLTF